MGIYTHRERVLKVFNHEEVDRIPIDLMGNASMLLDQTYLNLRDYLGLSPISPIRSGTTANYYDERILEKLDIDFRRIFLKKDPQNILTFHEKNSFSDVWGIRYQVVDTLVNVVKYPLSNMKTVKQIESYAWPEAKDMFTSEGLAERAKQLYKNTDYALVARNPLAGGFLEHSCNMMGMAEFLLTLVVNPALAQCIITHLLQIYKDVYTIFLDAVGPYVQMVEVSDDLGSQESLIMSPDMYRRFIKPAELELYSHIHAKAPNAALFHHTDGAVFDIIPDLIEVGVNVLNPVQTSSVGMEAARLKNHFGGSLTFHGTIESFNKNDSVKEVVAEVKSMIETFAHGGGYVIAPCNHVVDVSPESIVAMYETAQEFGQYR